MGTNYYAKLNLEKSIIDALYISPIAKMTVERFNLHIGKSSSGWKFLFQEQEIYDCIEHSGQLYYLDSYKKWKNFLQRDDIVIYNEYNKIINKDEFFKLVEDKQKEIHPTQEDLGRYPSSCRTMQYKDEEGYRFDKGDFS